MTALWAEDVPLLDPERHGAVGGEPDELETSLSPFADQDVEQFQQYEVIGDDTRRHVTHTTAVPYRWMCSLDVNFVKPVKEKFGRGSGLLIGPRHVLTAAHNLFRDGKTSPGPVYVAAGRNGDEEPFGRVKVAHIYILQGTLTGKSVSPLSDYALLKLEKAIGLQTFEAIGNQQLGWWGSDKLGQGTKLKPASLTYLNNKNIAVTGYPGDRCGTKPCNPHACNCSKEDQASTMWSGLGVVKTNPGFTRLFLHTADTAPGQSGSPVWMRFSNGERWVVGVHIDAFGSAPYTHNLAVHLSSSVIANLQAWMKK